MDTLNNTPETGKKDTKAPAAPKAKAKAKPAAKAKAKKPAAPAAPKAKKAEAPAAPKFEVVNPDLKGDFVVMENKAGQRHYCTREEMENAKKIVGKSYDWEEVASASNSLEAAEYCNNK